MTRKQKLELAKLIAIFYLPNTAAIAGVVWYAGAW